MRDEPFREGNLSEKDYKNAVAFIRDHSTFEPESVFLRLFTAFTETPHEEAKKKLFFLKNGWEDPIFLSAQTAEKLNLALHRIEDKIPVQYILKRTDFFGREFFVDQGVLIPRFDTEILVETALTKIRENGKFADLCCGSGCVGVTLLAERKDLSGVLADISPKALEITEKNVKKHKVQDRAEIRKEDVTNPAGEEIFDWIVSNPPYIPSEEIASLSPEVQKEPSLALDGGKDGLDFYRAILQNYKNRLCSGGGFLFECGQGQADLLCQLMERHGLHQIKTFRDAGGIDRVVSAKRNEKASIRIY